MSVTEKGKRKENIPDDVLAAFGQKAAATTTAAPATEEIPADVLAAFGEVKKKDPFAPFSQESGILENFTKLNSKSPSGSFDGVSPTTLTEAQTSQFNDLTKKYNAVESITFDNTDPVGSASKVILSKVKKPSVRQTDVSSTATQRPLEARQTANAEPVKGITYHEARKDLDAVAQYYGNNTANSLEVLSTATGLPIEDLYSPDKDDDIRSKMQAGNATQRIAYDRLQEAKAARSAIQSGKELEDMAANFEANKNPEFKAQLEKLQSTDVLQNQNIGQILDGVPVETIRSPAKMVLGDATMGKVMFDFLNSSAVQQEMMRSPEYKTQIKEQSSNLINNYPEFGKRYVGNLISQKMEDMGMSNGILNVVTKEEADKVVDAMIESKDISLAEKAFYEKQIRPRLGLENLGRSIVGLPNVATTGFVENAAQGGVQGLESFGKGIAEVTGARDIISGTKGALSSDLEKRDRQTGVTPANVWHEITQNGGQFFGQSASIGVGGRLLKAANIVKGIESGVALSGGMQAYGNYAPQARMMFPNSQLKQRGFATIMSGIEMATENIFNDDKVVSGILGEMKPTIANTIEKFTNKEITAAAAQDVVQNTFKKAAQSFGKSVGENTIEEVASQVGQEITEGAFQGKPVSEWLDAQELAQTARQAFLGSGFIAAAGVRADMQKNRGITAKQVYLMAKDPEYWSDQIKETARLDPSLEGEAQDKLLNLSYASTVLKELDGRDDLTEKQKAKYVLTSLDNKVRQQSESQKTDPTLRKQEQSQNEEIIKRNDQVKENILEGKDDGAIAGDNSDELHPEEKKVVDLLNENIQSGELRGMYAELAKESPIAVVQEIAQQAQGIDANGKEVEGGPRIEDLETMGVSGDVIDAAIKLYPKSVGLREDSTTNTGTTAAPSVLETAKTNISTPSITPAAQELLTSLDAGTPYPDNITPELETIAKDNNISISAETTPSYIIDQLKAKMDSPESSTLQNVTPLNSEESEGVSIEKPRIRVTADQLQSAQPSVMGSEKSEPPLTREASDLLNSIGEGSKPTFITKNLERIANENGIEVTSKMTADDVVNLLKEKSLKQTQLNVNENANTQEPVNAPSTPAASTEAAETTTGQQSNQKNKTTPPAKNTVRATLTENLRALLGGDNPALVNSDRSKKVSLEDIGILPTDTITQVLDKLIAFGGGLTNVQEFLRSLPDIGTVRFEQLANIRGREAEYVPESNAAEAPENRRTVRVGDVDNAYYAVTHEILHFLTLDSDQINKHADKKKLAALRTIYDFAANQKGTEATTSARYGLTDFREFMVELSMNPEFRKEIADIAASREDFKKAFALRNPTPNNILEDIRDFIRDIISKMFTGSPYSEIIDHNKPLIDNAVDLATELFFSGQDVISSQEQGAVIPIQQRQSLQNAALGNPALPEADRAKIINDFVTDQLSAGKKSEDIIGALVDNGIPEEEATRIVNGIQGDMTGITHAQMDELSEEFGLPLYQESPQTFAEWDAEATKRLQNPENIDKLLNKMRAEGIPTPVEQRMMIQYIASLRAKMRDNPTSETLKELNRAKDVSNIVGGRMVGQSLVARKGQKPTVDTLDGYLTQWTQSEGVETLPQERINELKQRFDKINDLKAQIDAAYEKGRQDEMSRRAQKEIDKQNRIPKQKKTHTEYVKERKDAVAAAREALRKLRSGESGLSAVPLPGVRELIAIAPHVNKVFVSLVSEGVHNLGTLIDLLHDEFKDLGVTPDQVRGMIAGEYKEPTETRNELAAQIRSLRNEAKALNEEPKKEKTESDKLQSKTKALQNKISKLQDRIDNHDYSQEAEIPPPVRLDAEGKKLLDQYVELKRQDAIRQAKADYDKQGKWRKRWDLLNQILGIRRLVQTGADFSIPLRQAVTITLNPFKAKTTAKAFYDMFASAWSQKGFRRYMHTLNESPITQEFKEFGGVLSEPDELKLDKREEEFRTNIVQRLLNHSNPVSKAIRRLWFSERAAAAFLNTARIEQYKVKEKALRSQGLTPENSPEEYKSAVKWIMNSTGRGNMLKMLEDSHAGRVAANNVFFGARLMASRMNLLNPAYYVKMPKETRIEAIKDMAGYVSGLALTGVALAAAGGKISFDPDDPDFMKARFGEKTYDLTGGMAVYVRTFLRLAKSALKATTTHTDKDKKEAKKYAEFAGNSTWKSIVVNKLSPNTSYAYHFFTQKGADGKQFDPTEILNIKPLYVDDFRQGLKDGGLTAIYTVLIPSLFGVGVQAYPEKKGYETKDLSDPVFKYFLDKGLDLPNTVPNSIEIKDRNTKTTKKLAEYPEAKINEYIAARRDNLKKELADIEKKGYVYVNDFGDVSLNRDKGEKKRKLDDLSEEQLAQLLGISARKATQTTKEQIFSGKKKH